MTSSNFNGSRSKCAPHCATIPLSRDWDYYGRLPSSETISYSGVAFWGAVRLLFRGYRIRTCRPRAIKFLTTHLSESLTVHFRQCVHTLGLSNSDSGRASASLLTMIAQGAQLRQSAQNGSRISPGVFGKSTLGSERGGAGRRFWARERGARIWQRSSEEARSPHAREALADAPTL
ncbi:hypothetical protein BC827DRAFT_578845 [Russula dissimulans]|nr:hypothetical protein BC827DRAFT_578845 [Russula dissimulans]